LINSLPDYLKKDKTNFKNKKIYCCNEKETFVHIVKITLFMQKFKIKINPENHWPRKFGDLS